jgi:DNA primase
MVTSSRVSAVDYYTDVVLPELYERLDTAFPEFGWRRDARGWIATNNEFTHRALGVRADRVVAHAPVPRGFLVHGGDATLWTAYVAGGAVPRGDSFVQAVVEIARRAGVDTAPLERPAPRDRRTDLLHDFFTLCRWELATEAGAPAREYLKQRGLPPEAFDRCGLGVVPSPRAARDCLRSSGYSEAEIEQSGVLADSRWSGRLCGGWRDERGRIRTLWARSLEPAADVRYLYLRGASRTNLPPYGLSWVLKQAPRPRDMLLVEGLLDVHHLRALGYETVGAVGGTGTRPPLFERLARLGFERVTLCFDADAAGRAATAKAVEASVRAAASPAVAVVRPERLGPAKDPDEFARERGVEAFRGIVGAGECAVTWRALEFTSGATLDSPVADRRRALAAAGNWLGSLPARLALEQEDAVQAVAQRCGYSPEAVARAFRVRFWSHAQEPPVATASRELR